jgi:hypothetical protein
MEPPSSAVIPETPGAVPTVIPEIPGAVPSAPSSVGEVLRTLPDLQAAATSTVKTLQNAASDIANVLGTFLGRSSDSSSSGEEAPSKGTPPPSSPFTPPIGDSFFSLLGAGQGGISSGIVTPLLLCVLILGLILLRRDDKLLRVFCELPKPSSALLLPLERPG